MERKFEREIFPPGRRNRNPVANSRSSRDYGIVLGNFGVVLMNFGDVSGNFGVVLRNLGVVSGNFGVLRNFEVVFRNFRVVLRNFEAILRNFGVVLRNFEAVSENFRFTEFLKGVGNPSFVFPWGFPRLGSAGIHLSGIPKGSTPFPTPSALDFPSAFQRDLPRD